MSDRINKFFARLATDERGLTAVEYAVLGAIIVAGVTAAGTAFNGKLLTAFTGLLT